MLWSTILNITPEHSKCASQRRAHGSVLRLQIEHVCQPIGVPHECERGVMKRLPLPICQVIGPLGEGEAFFQTIIGPGLIACDGLRNLREEHRQCSPMVGMQADDTLVTLIVLSRRFVGHGAYSVRSSSSGCLYVAFVTMASLRETGTRDGEGGMTPETKSLYRFADTHPRR